MRALAAAVRALRRFWPVLLATFAIQFALVSLASVTVYFALTAIAGGSPLFARGMDGDLSALIIFMIETPSFLVLPLLIGVATLVGYMAFSWFLSAGVIGVLVEKPESQFSECFGRNGATRFFAFLRLALWSLIPYLIVGGIAVALLGGTTDALIEALTVSQIFSALAPSTAVLAIGLWIIWTLVDVARISLVRADVPVVWRAVGFALKTVCKRPGFLAITLAGHLLSCLVLFVSIKLLGVGGSLGVFFARQLLHGVRHGIGVGVLAAEVDRFEEQR